MAISCKNFLRPKDFNLIISTSEVTQYDGGPFTCVTLPGSPTLNDVLEALEAKICSLVTHTHPTSDVVLYDGTPTFGCFSFSATPSLNTVIDELGTQICVNTTAIANLDCTDIEVTSQFSPVCYTPISSNLCGHLEGIDNVLCTTTSSVPLCLGNNLFTDGDNGRMELNITGMTSGNYTLTQVATPTFLGSMSLKCDRTSGAGVPGVGHSTSIATIAGNQYTTVFHVFIDSATAGTSASTAMNITVSGTGTSFPLTVILNDATSQYDKWLRFEHIYIPDVDQSVTFTMGMPNFTNGTFIFIDEVTVSCSPFTGIGFGSGESLATNRGVGRSIDRITNNNTSVSGTVTSSGVSLIVDIGNSEYTIEGLEVLAPDTSTTTSLTMAASSDNYLYSTSNGDGIAASTPYVIKSVALAAPQPTTDAGDMILYKFVTDGSGVTATTNLQVIYPFDGTFLADNSIITRHISDLNVTGAKMEDVVGAATVQAANVTFDAKGRITAATTNFAIAGPAVTEILIYDGADFVNAPIVGNILPSGTARDTLRFNGTNWITDSFFQNSGTSLGLGLGTSAPQFSFNMLKNLSFAINLEEPQNPSATAVAGGSLVDDTYFYTVTGKDDKGETIASVEVSAATSGANNSVDVTWDRLEGAKEHIVYKGIAAGVYTEEFTVSVPHQGWAATHTFTDDGTAGGATTGPPANTDAGLIRHQADYSILSSAGEIVFDYLTNLTIRDKGRDFVTMTGFKMTVSKKVTNTATALNDTLFVNAHTSGNMADTFNVNLVFTVSDDTVSDKQMGSFCFFRDDGSDDRGGFQLFLNPGGVITGVMTVSHEGKLGLGMNNLAVGGLANLHEVAGDTAIVLFNASVDLASAYTDAIALQAKDATVGGTNATMSWRLEQAVEVIGTFTESHKIAVWINGTEYHISLDAV